MDYTKVNTDVYAVWIAQRFCQLPLERQIVMGTLAAYLVGHVQLKAITHQHNEVLAPRLTTN